MSGNELFRGGIQLAGAVAEPRPGTATILRTKGDEMLRFFAADYSSPIVTDCGLFIRYGHVSVTHCIKEAMEEHGKEMNWVVIA